MSRALIPVLLASSLAGCASMPPTAIVAAEPPAAAAAAAGWSAIATPADRDRLAALPTRFAAARAAVPRRFAARVAAEGPLLDPVAALDLPALPPGSYRCRLVRLGGRAQFAAFAPDFCYVDGDARSLSFTKQTGENLPGGWIHADTDRRQIFLGTFRKGAATIAPPYGSDPARDIAGVVERIAPLRWRLVLARAGRDAPLDLYELVPAPPEPRPRG